MTRSRPRILLVGPKSPPYAGIETCTESLIAGLERSTLEWRHFNSGKPVPNAQRGRLTFSNIWWTARRVVGFGIACAAFRPDVVHLPLAHNRLGFLRDACFILTGRLCGAKVLAHCHNDSYDLFVKRQPPLLRRFIRWVYHRASGVVVQGNSLRGQFERLGLGDRLVVLTNHLDVAAFSPARQRNPASDRMNVLLLGRVSINKGAWDLVQAAREAAGRLGRTVRVMLTGETVQVDESVAHLAGESANVPALIAGLLKEQPAGLEVSYLGTLDFEAKLRALREADVLALPSHSEALPYAILEGAAAGLPIVATTVGMVPELVGRGLRAELVAPRDIAGLAEALVRLADSGRRVADGTANARFAEREFDVALLSERLTSLYVKVAGIPGSAEPQTA